MKIEKMTSAHIKQIASLEKMCFVHPWSEKSIEEELFNENALFLVCTDGERVLGYIGMSFVLDEGYIYNVAVDENFRNRGIATSLINELVVFAKKNSFSFLTLEVRESNAKAISLYSDFGFVKEGERKGYYSEPKENAIIMTKFF